jgi:hypothetical protein
MLHFNRNWLLPTRPLVVLFVGMAVAYSIRTMLWLPIIPNISPDSASYLSFADYRPPGYPVFLYAYRQIFGGLTYLPQVQFGLFFASVVLLALSLAGLTNNISSAFLVVLIGGYFVPEFPHASVLSDSLYGSFVVTGAACFVFFVSTKRQGLVCLVALFFALAIITRTIGYATIPPLVLSLVVLVVFGQQHARVIVLAGVSIGIVLFGACAISYAKTGYFRLGSYGGMSLLGKGLMIAAPLPPNHPFSSLNWIPEEIEAAQLELRHAPSLHLEILMLDEYYEYLRWDKMLSEFERRWPAWSQTTEDYDKGQLALELSKQYIANNPVGYAKLVLLDYLALWTMPRLITKSEEASLQRIWDGMNDVAFLTSFAKTEQGKDNYRKVVPQAHSSEVRVWVFRAVSFSFALASALVPIMLLLCRYRIAPAVLAALVLLGLNVHFAYATTAIVEGGLIRYLFPTWPLMAGALVFLPYLTIPSRRERPILNEDKRTVT